jgi:hypothetical protein
MPNPEPSGTVVSNSAFLRAAALQAPKGACMWATAFAGSPDITDSANWFGFPYNAAHHAAKVDAWHDRNAYFSVAALVPDAHGEVRRIKACFSRLLVLVADDMEADALMGRPSYVLETSPGKRQVGIFIDADDDEAADPALLDGLMSAMSARGMLRADMSGNNAVRYVRLPNGQNQKPRDTGAFDCRLSVWAPDVVLSLADACGVLGVDLDAVKATIASKPQNAPTGPETGQQAALLREAVRNIIGGELLHDSIAKAAASLVATGMHGGAATNMLRAMMEAAPGARDERWKSRYGDIPRAVETAVAKFTSPAAKVEPQALLLNLEQLRDAHQAIRWAVKHILPADSIGVMFGGSGTFKSFVALDLGLHLAHGLPWMGRKTTRGAVIYIAAEGGAGLWKRIEAWHKKRKLNHGSIPFYVVTVPLDLLHDAERVVEAAKAVGIEPALVVVDTMAQTFGGEENSATEVSGYLRALGQQFRATWRAAVLVLHHSGHQATERPRGSSAIRANVDFMFGVFREEKEMLARMECHKQKDGEAFAEVSFGLDSVQLGFDEDGDKVSSLVASHIAGDEELKARKQEEAAHGRGSRDVVAHRLAQPGMDVEAWRKAFYASLPSDMDADTKKRTFYRSRDNLERMALVETGYDAFGKRRIIVKVAGHD